MMRFTFSVLTVLICGSLPQAEAKGTKYALLVGVSKYDPAQLHDLPHVENDISGLEKALTTKCGYRQKNVYVMTSTHGAKNFRYVPSSRNIRRLLKGLIILCEKDDTLVLAFAGHGVQFVDETDNYFCPADAELEKKSSLINLQTEVYQVLQKDCKARVKLLFVDACRNDPRTKQARSRRRVKLQKLNAPQKMTVPKGLAAFFSCQAGEESFEHNKLGMGVFFHFLIKGLQGEAANREGQITLSSLKEYVRTEVKTYVFRELGRIQRPELKETSTDVILLTSPRGAVAGREMTNSIGMKLRLIPAGKFMMGSPVTEKQRSEIELQHAVEITRSYFMGTYEVTVGQFRQFVKATGYKRADVGAYRWINGSWQFNDGTTWKNPTWKQTDDFPVTCVSWDDAIAFCQWLSKKEGRAYRLPTEAEWEYACRGGAKKYQIFPYGDDLTDKHENFDARKPYGDAPKGKYLGRACKVGSYPPNGFGLYDMCGNVCEWCSDWYKDDYYKVSPRRDPQGPTEKQGYRARRGSCWNAPASMCRSADRGWNPPDDRGEYCGFRVVCEKK